MISSAGRRVELIQCFRADARELGLELRVLAADLNPELSAACHAADKPFKVPRCSLPEFISALTGICTQEGVDLVVPTIDTELLNLAEHRAALESCGTSVAISTPKLIHAARDKGATMRLLKHNNIPTPRTAYLRELLQEPDKWQWPVLLKPVSGSSSIDARKVRSLEEARMAAEGRPDFLAQELLEGREYTVNLFFDREGKLQTAVPHLRIETRGGEVSKGTTEREPRLMEIAETLGAVLGKEGARGPLCFQAIVTPEGRVGVFEINARFGGGYPLAHRAGAKFTKWLLEEAAGLPSSTTPDWQEGVTMLRYDAAVFPVGTTSTSSPIKPR